MRPHVLVAALLLWACATSAAQLGGPSAKTSAALNYASLPPGQQAVIAVVIDIPPGLHAQSHKPLNENFIALEVTVNANPALQVFEPVYPEGEIKQYPQLGKLSVYEGKTFVYVPIQLKSDVAPGDLKIEGTVTYQMCDDKTCFPPQAPTWLIETKIIPPGTALEPTNPDVFAKFDFSTFAKLIPVQKKTPKVELFGRELTAESKFFPFFAAFLIGIIFNVMPCVLPVVPLKIMGFYEVSQHNRFRSFALGLIFSLGIIAVFASLGLFVVILRWLDWGEIFANTWFLSAIVLILLIFGLSQFGIFTVGLPTAVYRFTPRHDTCVGNFLFGLLTAVLSTPCTFGMFLGLLIWATTQPAAFGMALLVTVGAGMAFPYVILSAVPEVARRFPRTGPWAELVKQMMGFLLIGSAVYFARRFIRGLMGDDAFWWVLFTVVVIAGSYLVIRSIQFSRRLLPRVVAVAVALLLVAPALAFTIRQTNPPIDWQPYTPGALEAARKSGKPVMLEFTADWCANCLTLEATTFHDPRTIDLIKRHGVVALRADLSSLSAPGWPALRQITAIAAIPVTAVYSAGSAEPITLAGIYGPDDLRAALETGKSAKPASSNPATQP